MNEHFEAADPPGDEQMMLLMAYADGELEGEELARARALIEARDEAAALVRGLGVGKDALRIGVQGARPEVDLSEVARRAADEAAAVQLMAHVDGELGDEERRVAGIDELLADSPAARTWVHDLRLSKRALHEGVMADELAPRWSRADLSMIHGRVMSRLPAAPRRVVIDEEPRGLVAKIAAWLNDPGWGRTAIAGAVMALALIAAIGLLDRPEPSVLKGPQHPAAQLPADGEPEVIIEEIETDGATVIMQEAEKPGEATIIWHIAPEEEQGAG